MAGRMALLGAAAMVVMVAGSGARAEECPVRNLPVDYRFDTEVAPPRYDNTRPKSWIETQLGGNRHTRAQTHTHIAATVKLGFSFLDHPGGQGVCAYVSKAHFKLGFDRIDVFIAEQFRPGTCQYQALKTHEGEHVAIARALLAKHRDAIAEAMQTEARRIAPALARDRKAAGDALGMRLSQAFKTEWKRFEAAHAEAQKAIDTKDSYRALEALCPAW